MGIVAWQVLVVSGGCNQLAGIEEFTPTPTPVKAPHRCDALGVTKKTTGKGPNVVLIEESNGSCFWMDETEVTVAHYQEWLDDLVGKAPPWKEACAWKAVGSTSAPSDPAGQDHDACRLTVREQESRPFDETKPIRCVDWCDAEAFCAWSGKRLCYGIDASGTLEPGDKPDEWRAACSLNDTRKYPFGDEDNSSKCNVGQDKGCKVFNGSPTLCGPTPVGLFGECRVSEQYPLDLSGNVREWIDLCEHGVDSNLMCQQRGGDYLEPLEKAACVSIRAAPRSSRDALTGVRCCLALDERTEAVKLP